jgi:uncharacterized protein YfaS (alpha-2-macroglobulin family)
MIGLVRAAAFCATLALGLNSAFAADKSFKRDDLADSAIKLEAEIKKEAGPIAKTTATLKTDADAAFKRNDFRNGLDLLGKIAVTAPEDSGNWLRLARTIFQIRPVNSTEQTFLLERASTAAYIAYQRAGNPGEEADALAVLGRAMADRKLWRPALDALRLSLDMREVADVRGQYEKMRDEHGFRLLDYTVDSDGATPRACFQFSEELAKRVDFSPFVAQAGTDKPALSSEGKQLCVEGLKHGERYNVNLRAGMPSAVKESLPKSAEFNIYVRDRKPFVRFTGKAYVLPRTGQRGIPLVSVNTPAVKVDVFRIGDRNLLNTVIDGDFQGTLNRYELNSLGDERGVKVWSGELATATTLNQDVTTAFPVDQALGDLQPGVYVMTASPKNPGSQDDSSLATQWFIVSDMGVTAFSGNDGVHVFVNSLASTEAVAKAEVRLIARNNEILATRKTDDAGHVLFEAGLARGEGGLSPAMVTVSSEKADYAFLSLKTNAFELSDRGVAGRIVPAGADAFVYAERGVYRSNETVHLTALLRNGQGNAVTGTPLTLVVERPDGVEYRRAVLPDQGAGGRSLSIALNSAVPTGTWMARAFTDPKAPAVGQTTFMVEDYLPERIEFSITSKEKVIKAEAPVELKVDGRFLYGAPASGLQLEGDMLVTTAASGRPGYPGYQFGVADEESSSNERTPIENLPVADDKGVATFPVTLAKAPTSTRPQEAQIYIRMAETGGRAVERKLVLPVAPATNLIGVKPLFGAKSVAEGDKAEFDVVFVAPDGKQLARSGLRYELMKIESRYQWYRHNSYWEYEPVKSTKRVGDGDVNLAADQAARLSFVPQPGRYRLDVKSTDADGPITSVQFDVGWYSDGGADTPDLLETSVDKPEYLSGDTMVVSVNARTAGKLTVNVLGDRLLTTQSVDVKEGTNQVKISVGKDWGTGAYVLATLRRPLDAAAQRMPGRAIGLKWFGIDKKARTLAVELAPPPLVRPGSALKIPVKVTGLNPGEDAKVVIAAVDVGILNLTNYKPPAPDDYYLGQRRLTAEVRDLYGQLIDGMQGTRGQIKSGGDAGAELTGSPPTQKPLALYSGIVTVGPDGSAEVSFDIPEFAGTARVMAVAWTATKLGRATTDVIVRDPVVLTATLPRFLLNGDKGTMSFDVDNVEGAAGDYTINVKTSGPVKVTGNPATTVKLAAKQRTSLSLALDAGGAGTANIDVDIKGPNGLSLARHYAVDVKAATQILARRSIRTLAKGESLTLTSDMFSDLVSGTGQCINLGQPVDRARCGDHPEGARPLSARLLRADHQPRDAAALCQRSRGRRASRHGHRRRPAHQGRDRAAAGASGLQRLVRPVVGRRRRRLARRLRHGLPDPCPRKGVCGAGCPVQERTRPPAQLGGQCQRAGKGRRPRSRLRPLCAGAQRRRADRRPPLSRRYKTLLTGNADCEIAARSGAGAGRRPGEGGAGLWRRARSARSEAHDRVRPHRLWQRTARCRRAGLACQRRQRAAGDADAGGSARRGGARADALHLHAGECLDGAGGARARQGNDVARHRRPGVQAGGVPQLQGRRDGRQADQDHQHRRCAGAGGGLGVRLAGDAGARRLQRLQDRAQLLHTCRQAGRHHQGEAERPLCRGAEDHRGQAGIRSHHGGRLSAGRLRDRQPAAGVFGR